VSFGSVELNPGTGGSKVAADIVTEGGEPREFQRIKLVWGPESTITPVDVGANALPVQDGGNSLTVDTPQLPAALVSGRLDVNIGSGVSGTEYTEDAAAPANPTAPAVIVVRDDARAGGLTSADGDNVALRGTNAGELYVKHFDSVRVQGMAGVDAALSGNPVTVGGRASTASPTAVSADDESQVVWMSRRGAVHVALRDDDGDSAMDNTLAAVRVTQVAAAGTSLADNTANPTAPYVGSFPHWFDGATWDRARGDSAGGAFVQGPAAIDAVVAGNPIIAGARASTATPSVVSADGDVQSIWIDRVGRVKIDLSTATVTIPVQGNAAHDAAASSFGNPFLTAGRASDAVPSAVSADGDISYTWLDRRGATMARLVDSAGDSAMDDTNNSVRVSIVSGSVSVSGTVDTELPAAGALSDDMANPTTPLVGSCLMVYDGNWDRAVGTSGRLAVQGAIGNDGALGSFNPINVSGRASSTAPADVSANDDAVYFWLTRKGALNVSLRDSAGDSAMDDTNNAVWINPVAGSLIGVVGVTPHDGAMGGTPVAVSAYASDAATTPVSADGDATYVWANRRGALQVGIRDGSGDSCMDDTNNALRVNVINLVDEYVEDAAAPANPEGPAMMLRRRDTPSTSEVSADLDWVTANGNSAGGMYVEVLAGATKLGNASGLTVQGAAATDAAVAGNPLYVGGRASAAEPTAVSADGDAVPEWRDLKGRAIVTMQCGTCSFGSVSDTTTSATLISANTARKGATVTNTSTADLYIKCGSTASATSHNAIVKAGGTWECPFGYTGIITGVWATDPNTGAANTGEFT
jgi:hypothetical protein